MADLYRLEIVDRASPPARQVETALRNVARAALVADKAFRSQDRGQMKMASAFERVARSELRSARALRTLANEAPKATRGLTIAGISIGTALGSIAVRGLEAGARALIGFGERALNTADHIGRNKIALAGMLGSQEAANAEIATATRLAKIYGLGISETIDQLRKFAAFGFGAKQREGLLKMAGDMKGIGMTAEQIDRSMNQISQIQTKGKLQGEELIVLAENGINVSKVYERLEKRLGKTRDELIKMQKAGQIKSGDALNAVAEAVVLTAGAKKLGEAGEKAASSTVGGVLGQISAGIEEKWRAAIESAEPQMLGALQRLKTAVEGFDFAAAFDLVTKAIDVASKAVVFFSENMGTIKTVAGAVFDVFTGLARVVGKLVDTFSKPFEINFKVLGGLGSLFTGDSVWAKAGENIASGVAAGVNAASEAPAQAVEGMAGGMIARIKEAFRIHSPSRVMADDVGSMLPPGVAAGIEAEQQLAFTAAKEMADGTIYSAERGLNALPATMLAATGDQAASSAISTSESRVFAPRVTVPISIDGSDASTILPQLKSFFENDFASMLEMQLEGAGA